MHKIDRYGVIALVFMAVTFLAVYFWDDHGKTRSAVEKDARGDAARVEPRPDSKPPAPAHREATEKRGTTLPLSPNDPAPLHASARQETPRTENSKKEADGLPHPLPAALDEGAKNQSAAGDERSIAESEESPAAGLARPDRASGREAIELAAARESLETPENLEENGPKKQREAERGRAAETARASTRSYTVAKGDTLEAIAARELGSRQRWGEIQALNGGLDPRKLWVGKVLQLPAGKHVAEGTAAPQPERSKDAARTIELAANTRSYVVKKGDILGTIAQRELGSAKAVPRIAALNPGMDPNRLLPGMKLVLPAGTATKTNAPLELSTNSSKEVARLEPRPQGAFKVR